MTAAERTRWDIPHAWQGRIDDGARPDPHGAAVSSLTADGRHLPVLDIDVPARLEASRRPGHAHLYLDVPMTWAVYSRLLHALADAGVIEAPHFVRAVDCGATYVTPGPAPKPPRAAAARYFAAYAVLVVRACWRETRRRTAGGAA